MTPAHAATVTTNPSQNKVNIMTTTTQTETISEKVERLEKSAANTGFAMALPTSFHNMTEIEQLQIIVDAYTTILDHYTMDKSEYSELIKTRVVR